MEKNIDIITSLDICVDFLVSGRDVVPEFGQKEKLVDDYSIEMGGSCCIFACQAARLNLKTAGIGAIGQDAFGRLALEKMEKAGVISDYIRQDSELKTGMGIALCKETDRAILTYLGTIDAVEAEHIPEELLAKARHIHVGSYFLMKKLQPHYPVILRRAKELGMTVSLDTNWDPEEKWDNGIWNILQYVDIFLPNENEAMAITKKDNMTDALKMLGEIIPIIAVKLGKNGAAAFSGGKKYSAAPYSAKVVDTVGAGDSFDAGFVYGYLSGCSIERSLQIGCICGSMSTTKPGGIAGQAGLTEMLQIYHQYMEV